MRVRRERGPFTETRDKTSVCFACGIVILKGDQYYYLRVGEPGVRTERIRVHEGCREALPPARSQLAENVLKERIKSFGFRV